MNLIESQDVCKAIVEQEKFQELC